MIQNDAQLQVVREQLALAKHALASLRGEIKNPRNLALFSEGPLDQIAELKAEIAAYEKATKKSGKANGKGGRRGRKAS